MKLFFTVLKVQNYKNVGEKEIFTYLWNNKLTKDM